MHYFDDKADLTIRSGCFLGILDEMRIPPVRH